MLRLPEINKVWTFRLLSSRYEALTIAKWK